MYILVWEAYSYLSLEPPPVSLWRPTPISLYRHTTISLYRQTTTSMPPAPPYTSIYGGRTPHTSIC